MDCYSPLKVFHHREHIDALREGRQMPPIHLQIIPTNKCNQRCSFCAYRDKDYSNSQNFDERDEIPSYKLLALVNSAHSLGVRAVEITGGGEPMLHPAFPELCYELKELGMDFGVVTNGSCLNGKGMEALVGASWVRFSLDAARPETYAKLRGSFPDTLGVVRRKIKDLRNRSPKTIVGVGFVVTAENWKEVLAAAVNAKEDGAHNVRISAIFQTQGESYFNQFYQHARDLCRECMSLADENFAVFNMFGDRVSDLRQQSPSHCFCGIQHLVSYLGADQNLYRCCVLAYNQRGLLGSVKKQSLQQAWEGAGQKLADFDARECPLCMFNQKNATIRYAINPNPDHVNFL